MEIKQPNVKKESYLILILKRILFCFESGKNFTRNTSLNSQRRDKEEDHNLHCVFTAWLSLSVRDNMGPLQKYFRQVFMKADV